MSINRVNISGNLTRDPELRVTQGGTSILSIGVAVNDRRRNPQTGEWEDYPNYIDCVVFGSRAEPLSRFLSKGTKVAVEGKLRWSQWERDGQKRSKIEVVVDDIDFELPHKNQQAAPPAPQQGYPQQGYPQQPQQYAQGGYVQQPAIAQPQSYQQAPQSYGQPVSAPQAPQPANYPQQAQTAPQVAPQPPQAPQQMQMAPQAPAMDVYDEDIPF